MLTSSSHAHDPVVVRDNNKEDLASFLETLKEVNWSSLDGYHEPKNAYNCLLYTSPSPRDGLLSRMPSSA